MTTKSRKSSAGQSGNAKPQTQTQPKKAKKPAFVSRYIGIDSHFTERNGSTDDVLGIAAERPAGRKLAEDIARTCVQLDADGYDIVAIFPLTSGRAAEATVETENIHGRTYSKRVEVAVENPHPWGPATRTESRWYIDTGIGYSVTDGVIITAKLREQSHSS